eukprot:CAMPEP_0118925972 /NCGR_PEP_ID=MMETSP1169-20130426/3769_1 /TAXON_ID=36882 /ORGANISM="Pyramimonas obovata, Strain CCMP722" /LENGTH=347 /DNA_ID=CAMNT_0006867423 /DNA_START=222 /DNA_END=1262 /DNA_ORIENTATION=-
MSAFNEKVLTEKLLKLNNSQQSIVNLSHWCVFHRKRAKLVVQTWHNEFAKAPKERRLAFIYLANDVLQNSRKKGPEFVDEFFKVMPRAFKHLSKQADEKVKASLMKLIKVWEDRKVFGHALPPAIRESLLGTAVDEKQDTKEAKGTKRSAADLSGPLASISSAHQALESAEAKEARAASICAGAVPAELLAESALTRASEAGRVKQLTEQLNKALESIEAYRSSLEESLTQRENLIGAIRDAQRSQEELFEETETKLSQMREQAEKVMKSLEQAQALEGQEPRPAGSGEEAAAAGGPDDTATAEKVAADLAALENPAAALRDALSGLSAAELNLFGSSLAQLAAPAQ